MFSSSKEELDKLLRDLISGNRPRNFEERRLLDMENRREFRVNFRLSKDAFAFGINKPAIRVDISID